MFCGKCGMNIPDVAVFCPGCGSKVEAIPAAPVAPAESVAPAVSAPPDQPKKKKNMAWLYVLIGVLVVAIVGAVLYFTGVFDGDNGSAKEKDNAPKTTQTTQAIPPATPAEAEALAKTFAAAAEMGDYNAKFPLYVYNREAEFIDFLMEDFDSEEALFATWSDALYVKIDSWNKLFAEMHAYTTEDADETYGTYTIETTVTESEPLAQSDINAIVDEMLTNSQGYCDEEKMRAITEAYMVYVTVAVNGDEASTVTGYEVYVFNDNGEWKVATYFYYEYEESSTNP